jgi:D-glycero-D-manno-heptose 1,7-bisphosphate phosphatase
VGVHHTVSTRAVFLDRDGVINRPTVRDGRPFPPGRPEDFALLPGVRSALEDLKHAGFVLVVVTNQPDVRRGAQARDVVESMHQRLREELPVDAIYSCYHDDDDRCSCRKPAPGLLLEAAHTWDIDLKASFMVGDRWRDTEAGAAAGCRTLFIDHGYTERQPEAYDAKVSSLSEAAEWILARGAS